MVVVGIPRSCYPEETQVARAGAVNPGSSARAAAREADVSRETVRVWCAEPGLALRGGRRGGPVAAPEER